jgi:hypothetical protein
MKTAIILLQLLMLDYSGLHRQQQYKLTIPLAVKSAFAKMFPEAKGTTWKEEPNVYMASYESNGHTRVTWFDSNGKWLKRETPVPFSCLLQAALDYLKETFGNIENAKASKICEPGGTVTYRISINGSEVFFTEQGELKTRKS